MKKYFGLMIVTLLGLASCTMTTEENEEVVNADYVQDVFVKFENVEQTRPGTRADEAGKTNSDKVAFASGYLFLVTNQDNIKLCYRITPTGGAATNLAQRVINVDDFWKDASKPAGYAFQNISGEVKKVYIIGNMPDAVAEATVRSKTTLTELKDIAVPLTGQSDIEHVTMDGIGALSAVGGDETKQEVSVQLSPLCSRIEIAKITATGAVSDYKLRAIYVSHFYSEMALDEDNNPATQQLFVLGNSGGADYAGTYQLMCDEADVNANPDAVLTTTVSKVATPAHGVWGYQFFPGIDADRISPRVVVKLTDIASTIGSYASPQYLNIRGFKTSSDPNAQPMGLARGQVYKIEDLQFKESDLSDVPNPADISLTVKVSVNPWTITVVKPVM